MSLTIDTNILIYHLERDQGVSAALEQWLLDGERLFVSAITRIEILAAPILREDEEKKIYYEFPNCFGNSMWLTDAVRLLNCIYMATQSPAAIFEKIGRLEKELQRLKVAAYFTLPKKDRAPFYSQSAILRAAKSIREDIWRERYAKKIKNFP